MTDGNSFTTKADVSVAVTDWAKLTANVTLEQVEYEEIAFAGGQAIDMTNISSEEIEKIKSEVHFGRHEDFDGSADEAGRPCRFDDGYRSVSFFDLKEGDSNGVLCRFG